MGRVKENDLRNREAERAQTVLGDLTLNSIDIFCWCNRCGHNAIITTDILINRFGPALAVPEVGALLRCSGCGSKDVATRPNWRLPEKIARHG
ncbi:MAG: hypothetical protein P1V34_08395 [Alphaproteobacteria bacterium]|nr:hypothetical protein [Alphaproteobacteria bacterium]